MSTGKGNIKEQKKRYRLRYPEKKKEEAMRTRRKKGIKPRILFRMTKEQIKAGWQSIIIENNFNRCAKCGYNKCFGAIDFHHPNNSRGGKKDLGGYILNQRPTSERIDKLRKCTPLCANCHRELHVEEKSMGIHKNQIRKELL